MICAVCGEEKELCRSVRENGIQQPRMCKECYIDYMRTNQDKVNDIYWIAQLKQAGDDESIKRLIG